MTKHKRLYNDWKLFFLFVWRFDSFVGLQFPWESAMTGREASPAPSTGKYQIHISGDVALAVWQVIPIQSNDSPSCLSLSLMFTFWGSDWIYQFFQVTGDKEWLREIGWPLLCGVAEFYAGRAVKRSTGFFWCLFFGNHLSDFQTKIWEFFGENMQSKKSEMVKTIRKDVNSWCDGCGRESLSCKWCGICERNCFFGICERNCFFGICKCNQGFSCL